MTLYCMCVGVCGDIWMINIYDEFASGFNSDCIIYYGHLTNDYWISVNIFELNLKNFHNITPQQYLTR